MAPRGSLAAMSRFVCKLATPTFALALLLSAAGCATIIKGKNQLVRFDSVPDGATVSLSGRKLGVTPFLVNLERKDKQVVRFEKEGYRSMTANLTTKVEPWFFGNFLLGGPLGSTTDAVSGAMYQYAPDAFVVTLVPEDAGPVEAAPSASAAETATEKARGYILINWNELHEEIAKGSGAHLAPLYELLRVPQNQRRSSLARLQEILDDNATAPTFADETLRAFMAAAPAGIAAKPGSATGQKSPGYTLAVFPWLSTSSGSSSSNGAAAERNQHRFMRHFALVPGLTVAYSSYPLDTHGKSLEDDDVVNTSAWSGAFNPEPDVSVLQQKAKELGVNGIVLFKFGRRRGNDQAYVTEINMFLYDAKSASLSNRQLSEAVYSRGTEPSADEMFDKLSEMVPGGLKRQ